MSYPSHFNIPSISCLNEDFDAWILSRSINSLIFTIAAPLTFTVSHRWYYFYLGSVSDFYNSSIVLLSLDLRTTWKEP